MWRHMLGKMVANVYISAAIFRKIWCHIEFFGTYEKGNTVNLYTLTPLLTVFLAFTVASYSVMFIKFLPSSRICGTLSWPKPCWGRSLSPGSWSCTALFSFHRSQGGSRAIRANWLVGGNHRALECVAQFWDTIFIGNATVLWSSYHVTLLQVIIYIETRAYVRPYWKLISISACWSSIFFMRLV